MAFQDQISTDVSRNISMTLELATLFNMIDKSIYVWFPELIMFAILRVLPAPPDGRPVLSSSAAIYVSRSARNQKWLLIFDNADDMDMWLGDNSVATALTDFLPQSEQGCILFTIRNRKLAVNLASSSVLNISEPDAETGEQELDVIDILSENFEDQGRYKEILSIFSNHGQWKEAEELDVQVLEIRKQVLGPVHPETLRSMANLAATYRDLGRLKEAEELGLQVIESHHQVLGPEHPDTLSSMANLAYTCPNILHKVINLPTKPEKVACLLWGFLSLPVEMLNA
ncbi:hypothetical protein BDW59DRAFT_164884 [Aspergillus cavernicola]|uniref:Uncharacterized protein n=1 Tax=Aspergillus cavernicola TaxID=176166 RepID=A0ABR4HWI3_9EURO